MIKKPLVLANGEIEQLQGGDSLSPVPNILALENGDTGTIPIGNPVYISSADTFIHAVGEDFPNVVGLTAEEILSTEVGSVQVDGKLVATTVEWDAVTGQTGGLTSGETYYLGYYGGLSIIPPTSGYLVRLGIAINSTDLEIKISRPIKL